MRPARRFLTLLLAVLLAPFLASAADFDNPFAGIAANPQLSELRGVLKKTGYDEPLRAGGDVTFLALSNTLLSKTRNGERFSNLEMFRDKIPPEAQLQLLQALTIDGQYTHKDFEEMIAAQGNGKVVLNSILGPEVRYRLYRGKENATYVLEDMRHIGMLLKAGNEIDTPNGTVIVIDANSEIPK